MKFNLSDHFSRPAVSLVRLLKDDYAACQYLLEAAADIPQVLSPPELEVAQCLKPDIEDLPDLEEVLNVYRLEVAGRRLTLATNY